MGISADNNEVIYTTDNASNLVRPNGFMGVFGRGAYRIFEQNGTFVVPAGISKIRVRVVGGGGGGGNCVSGAGMVTAGPSGGGGGGYAHGVFSVAPGASFPVVVGAGGLSTISGFPGGGNTTTATSGGASSFGALISATGGLGGKIATVDSQQLNNGGLGGTGTGGDFQATGGQGGAGRGAYGGGGGGSGSQLGDGGSVSQLGNYVTGGGGVVGWVFSLSSALSNQQAPLSYGVGGASAFGNSKAMPGANAYGMTSDVAAGGYSFSGAVIRFPFDGFMGAGGLAQGGNGGSGGGGGGNVLSHLQTGGGYGGSGGDGGGGGGTSGFNAFRSLGGIGGGGGGCGQTNSYGVGHPSGGSGIVIVEY